MSYTNNNGTLPSPQFISAIDLTVTNRQKFVKYFNYNVFNFAKQYSNPLILPFNVTLDVIYHGQVDVSSNKFESPTFAFDSVIGNKFHITGEGTAYFWYRYGSIDPASFDLIAKTAINNKDWLVLDAVLHTRSIIEVIDFITNNPDAIPIFAEGLDWQLNEIGARDFFAYLTGNVYDTRKLAQFLTIVAYVDPDVLTKEGIPVYNYDNPNRSFEAYLDYLPTSFIVPIESELSEQSSEISELFYTTSELTSEIIIEMYKIMQLFAQSSEHQSEIDNINSEIDVQSSEIANLFSITSEQGIEISDLIIETSAIDLEVEQLSENLILFTNAGEIINDVLRIFHLFKAVLIILKILQHVIKTVSPTSELNVLNDLGETLDNLLGITSESIFTYTSELDLEGIIQLLVSWLNQLLGINLILPPESSKKEKKEKEKKKKKKEKDDDKNEDDDDENNQNGLGLGLGLDLGLDL